MATVALAKRYLDTLQAFGDVDILVNQAVEKYLIDHIASTHRRKSFGGLAND